MIDSKKLSHEGSFICNGNDLPDGWEWLGKKTGNLKVRRYNYPNPYIFGARVPDDGTLYFNSDK